MTSKHRGCLRIITENRIDNYHKINGFHSKRSVEEWETYVIWLNLSRKVFTVTSKNEWSCLHPLRCEITAVFSRSVQVNVLSEVPLPIPLLAWAVCFTAATLGVPKDLLGCSCAGTWTNMAENCSDGPAQMAMVRLAHLLLLSNEYKAGVWPPHSEWQKWLLSSWLF